jgi:hypothetical protein
MNCGYSVKFFSSLDQKLEFNVEAQRYGSDKAGILQPGVEEFLPE